ncbi:MAG: AAA family ATPase [Gemmatimonadota bacterium]
MTEAAFRNPFRPGAGHPPPYLAGRREEREEFGRLLQQETILENLILTGLRGVGKTVLLETFKPLALQEGWLWAGADLSESTSVSEEMVATRLLTDLALVTSGVVVSQHEKIGLGFSPERQTIEVKLSFDTLLGVFTRTPGLVADKLKAALQLVWACLVAAAHTPPGIVFAYDEAQNMSDHAEKEQYPLSLLLDVFQSLQRKGIPFMLVLTGLPTLFPKLVEARTYSERMFRVLFLDRLPEPDVRDAILVPMKAEECPFRFDDGSIELIAHESGGYPYFIQFICREAYDAFLQRFEAGEKPRVPVEEITRKLDSDFFTGRWSRVTDRQRALLFVIATLEPCDEEFTVQEIVMRSRVLLEKPFSASHTNQMLASLANAGLVYKNRHGKYSFAVPLLGQYIRRQSNIEGLRPGHQDTVAT